MHINEIKHYYDLGFSLLWLLPRSKRPFDMEWTGKDRTHWDILKKTHKKNFNVGVRLGRTSQMKDGTYLCVLDCDVKSSDPHHLKEMELALNNFCPANEFAPRVISGRGGGSCHIYFRTKEPQQSFKALRSAHKVKVYMPSVAHSKADMEGLTQKEIDAGYRFRLAWEIDVYGEGKQVVLPPSIHPDTNKPYEWDQSPPTKWDAIPFHKPFSPTKKVVGKSKKKIEFQDVDLFSVPLSNKAFDLIVKGDGIEDFPSRSEALFSSINALVGAGLSDEQIYTVLTDHDNFMSEKAIEKGGGSKERSAFWLSSQVQKAREDRLAAIGFTEEAMIDDLDEELSDDAAKLQSETLVTWRDRLHTTKHGYKTTAYNVSMILKNAFGEPILAFDEFKHTVIFTKAPPWGKPKDVGRMLIDNDDTEFRIFFSKEWEMEVGDHMIRAAVDQVARENSFHPVKRYLESIKWDGKRRLATWLKDYMGAEGDSRYLRDVGVKTLVAAVARIYRPGVKFDQMTIFEGFQGAGKSTTCRILAGPEWFSDSLGDIESKDVINNMRGKWIIEVGELRDMNRSAANTFKAFLSKETDTARLAFARREGDYPRQCIFIGSTNDQEYLKDETGGRRFWPVKIGNIDTDKLRTDRDQLWAEAVYLFHNDEPLWITDKEVLAIAKEEQNSRYMVDQIQDDISETIKSAVHGFDLKDEFTFADLWKAMNHNSPTVKPPDNLMQSRIKKSLLAMGYKRIQKRIGDWRDRQRIWVYRKSESPSDVDPDWLQDIL